MKNCEMSVQDRFNLMIAAGHPVFVIGRSVSWPAEAKNLFTPEELAELERSLLSSR